MDPDRKKYFEILAVLLTGLLKFLFVDWLHFRAFYIGLTSLCWITYVFKRYRDDQTVLKNWGFQKEHFRRSFLFLLPFAIMACAGILIYGHLQHMNILNWHVIPILFLYPVWGLIQQFMITGLVAKNIKELRSVTFKTYQVALFTSLLFALVHYPSIFLMIFVFCMELAFIFTYFKWGNLWSLGLYHGVIASLLLFFVRERDLWLELWPVF